MDRETELEQLRAIAYSWIPLGEGESKVDSATTATQLFGLLVKQLRNAREENSQLRRGEGDIGGQFTESNFRNLKQVVRDTQKDTTQAGLVLEALWRDGICSELPNNMRYDFARALDLIKLHSEGVAPQYRALVLEGSSAGDVAELAGAIERDEGGY